MAEPMTMVVMLLSAAPAFDPLAELVQGKLGETVLLDGVTFAEDSCAKVSGVARVTGADRPLLKRCLLQALGSNRWRSGNSGPTKTSRLFEVNGFAWELRFVHDDRGPHGTTTPRDERLVAITRWDIAQATTKLFGQLPRIELRGPREPLADAGLTSGITMHLCVNVDGMVLSCDVSGFGATTQESISAVERQCPRTLKPMTLGGEPLSVCVDSVVRLREP